MRLEETESILEFENKESSNLFHSLLTIPNITLLTAYAVPSNYST